MIALRLIRLGLAIDPAINRGKSNADSLREFFLGDSILKAVFFEFADQFNHGLHFIASLVDCQFFFSQNSPSFKGSNFIKALIIGSMAEKLVLKLHAAKSFIKRGQ